METDGYLPTYAAIKCGANNSLGGNMKEQNYRKAREDAGIRPERAATELGISITTLFSWERGETSPTANKLVDMSNLYGKKIDYLLALE